VRLIVGAPVAHRAWALPRWFECLAAQTVRPDGVVLLHSGNPEDETWRVAIEQATVHGFDLLIEHDHHWPHERTDNKRYATLAGLRNELLRLVRDKMRADLFLSLDTDIMLEDPETIQRLDCMLTDGCDLASCATFLHPAASAPDVDEEIFWAYNAGWVNKDRANPWDARDGWLRPLPNEIDWTATYRIDIPMGVWLGNRQVLDCRYKWHVSGEDLGFAQDLQEHGLVCRWDASLRARHYWQESHLPGTRANPLVIA
jgi:hypothetical protein